MKTRFFPPRDNPTLIRAAYFLLPVVMRLCKVAAVRVSPEDRARLESLAGSRLILSANHPTGNDPLIAMVLAKRMGGHLNFVAAQENFETFYGWLYQRLGAYSIHRGLPDRDSLQMTRRLLAVQDRKVALFPEGETYYHNDITLPFQSGVAQLGFWTLGDLQKLGKEPTLPILPVAIKYCYRVKPQPEIESRMAGLEKALSVDRAAGSSLYARLVAIGETIVMEIEKEYRLSPMEASLEDRITRLKDHILNRVAAALGEPVPEGTLPDRMRSLFNAVRGYSTEFMDPGSEYEKKLQANRLAHARPLFADLLRLQNCIALNGHYVRDYPTWERFSETLARLEEEVIGHSQTSALRDAHVRIGEPIELGDWLDEYKKDRRSAVEAATHALETRIIALLHSLWPMGRKMGDL